jgi:hypothetical protein
VRIPFLHSVTHDGYLLATDGAAIFMLAGGIPSSLPKSEDEWPNDHPPSGEIMREMCDRAREWAPVVGVCGPEEVLKLVGVDRPDDSIDCEACAGSGECECAGCGLEHVCGECNGHGSIERWSGPDSVKVAGRTVIDARRLRPWWALISGHKEYSVACGSLNEKEADDCTIAIRGDGFVLALMGLRGTEFSRQWPEAK